MDTLFVDFEQHLVKRESKAPRTARRYAQIAKAFCARIADVATARPADIERWRDQLDTVIAGGAKKDASPATINQRIAGLRAFFDFAVEKKLRRENPMDAMNLKMVRVPPRDPRPFAREEIAKFFEHLYGSPHTPVVIQDRAILEVLYGSGLRREEAAVLPIGHFEGRTKLKVIGKGNKMRRTIVTPAEYLAVSTWAVLHLGDERSNQITSEISVEAAFEDLQKRFPELPLFYLSQGATITKTPMASLVDPGEAISRRCEEWFAKTGVKGSPHRFRHSFATVMLTGGASLFEIGGLLGHSDPRSTAIYTGFENAVFNRLQALHPRSN